MKCVTRSENEQMNNLVKRYARYYVQTILSFTIPFLFFLLFLLFFFLRLRIFVPFHFIYFFSFFFYFLFSQNIHAFDQFYERTNIDSFLLLLFFFFLLFLLSFCNVYITCKGSSIRWSRNVEETHKHPPIDLYWSRRIQFHLDFSRITLYSKQRLRDQRSIVNTTANTFLYKFGLLFSRRYTSKRSHVLFTILVVPNKRNFQ